MLGRGDRRLKAPGRERRLALLVDPPAVDFFRRQIARSTVCDAQHQQRRTCESLAQALLKDGIRLVWDCDQRGLAEAPDPDRHAVLRLGAERLLQQYLAQQLL